ncbi:alpha/beta-hydrolase [Trametes meyenii]|nr:alpha/beta-hydrolase [Trametes meyenii]
MDTYNGPKTGYPAVQPTQSHHYAAPYRRLRVLVVAAAALAAVTFNFCGSTIISGNGRPLTSGEEPKFDWDSLVPAKTIQWAPCYSGHKCARLILPLDYDTPDGPTTAIALRLIPTADRKRYKGTVLVNPGGPGASGTEFAGRAGQKLSHIIGDSFDILGFDPRGIGASTPAANCFETDSQRNLWRLQDDHRLLNITNGSLEIVRARERLVAERCEAQIGSEWGIGGHMSTPNVARDMLEISQQLGQEKVLYWGFSYGSVLGQYFAAIFPDKVGRVVIDGVYDAVNFRAGLWNSNLVFTDAAIDSFFHFCHQAGPDKCSLYELTASQIRKRFFDVVQRVEKDPIPVPLAEPPLIITHKVLSVLIFQGAYGPIRSFPLVADTIRAIEDNNQTALAGLAREISTPLECKCNEPPAMWRMDDETFSAIACGDSDEHPFDLDTYTSYYAALARDSALAAPLWGIYYLTCAEWKIRAKARWTRELGAAHTAHPLLVVSPRFDPVCPLTDAQAAHARFGGSALLVQNSVGHCSLSAPSLCTAKHVRAYFENGTLPEPGTVCEVEELPFVGSVQSMREMSVEDAGLLESLKGLTETVPRFGRF